MIKAHDEQPLRKTLKMSHKEKHYRERNLELFRLKKVWLMDLLGGLINRVLGCVCFSVKYFPSVK